MAQGFEGRRVVITGGAGGIGQAIAQRFLAAGASVVLGDVDEAALERARIALGPDPGIVRCDVEREADCRRLIEASESLLSGPVDVFVAHAGVPFSGTLADCPADEIRRVISVNVIGSILSAQAALASLRRGTDPCLLFMGSLQSLSGRAARSVYTASKHAIAGLVKSLALELGPDGIRVNALAPTVVDTPFLHEAYRRVGLAVEQGLSDAARALPLGRIPTVEDVAETALFLCSPAARAITGQIVPVDCGALAGRFDPPKR